MYKRQVFRNDPQYFPTPRMREIIDFLHAHDQRYSAYNLDLLPMSRVYVMPAFFYSTDDGSCGRVSSRSGLRSVRSRNSAGCMAQGTKRKFEHCSSMARFV